MTDIDTNAHGAGEAEGPPEPPPSPRGSRKPLVAGLIVLLGFAGLFVWLRDDTPLLTREALDAHWARWRASGVTDYEMVLAVENPGQDTSRYRVVVEGGEVTAFEMNGRESPPNSAYSVDGLFQVLERELERLRGDGPGSSRAPAGTVLRAAFDDVRGFPRAFKRIEHNKSTFLRVESFEGESIDE